jgi:hypothetical protein
MYQLFTFDFHMFIFDKHNSLRVIVHAASLIGLRMRF